MEYRCGSGVWKAFPDSPPLQVQCLNVGGVDFRGTDSSDTSIEFRAARGLNSFSGGWETVEDDVDGSDFNSYYLPNGCSSNGSDRSDRFFGKVYVGGERSDEDRDGSDDLDVDTGRAGSQIHIRYYCVSCHHWGTGALNSWC